MFNYTVLYSVLNSLLSFLTAHFEAHFCNIPAGEMRTNRIYGYFDLRKFARAQGSAGRNRRRECESGSGRTVYWRRCFVATWFTGVGEAYVFRRTRSPLLFFISIDFMNLLVPCLCSVQFSSVTDGSSMRADRYSVSWWRLAGRPSVWPFLRSSSFL
jgi:hypothetical protein